MADFKVTGFDDLNRALDDMVSRLDRAGEETARKGGQILVAEIRRAAPVGKSTPGWTPPKGGAGTSIPAHTGGTLRRSVVAGKAESIGPGQWQIKAGPTVVYGRFRNEGGTIRAKGGGMLRFMAINSFNVRKGGKFSYAPAFARSVTQIGSHYMDRAVETAKPQLERLVRDQHAQALRTT